MRIVLLFCFLIAFGYVGIDGQEPAASPEVKKANERPQAAAAGKEPFDDADVKTMASKCVELDTEAGLIIIELYPESAPETVRNFLNLVAMGFFNMTTFSRVVPDFVVQGGNVWTREGGVTTEMGARARRRLKDEPNRILHERGIVSMARGEEANTATTNFFILVSDSPHLDGTFAAFGRVVRGMDVADEINKSKVTNEKPEKPVRIKKASVKICGAD